MPADPIRARSLFLGAVDLPDTTQRIAYLDRECANDAALRAQVEAMLRLDAVLRAPAPTDDATRTAAPPIDPERTGAYSAPSDAHASGTLIAGRYKLQQTIGEGGMGTVWVAEQLEPVKRRVALKLIRVERGQSKTLLARFDAERQAIALMDHPHIAKLLDAGTTDTGAPFFVMELVQGVPLNEYCDQHKLSVNDRLALFVKICAAVQHAHQKGIIHRDLKPGNILVETRDGKPLPKVIDFGLAKATTGLQLTDHSLYTSFGSVLGTPLYMAPEQANVNALDVDTRADVYALGVILYELLTGTTPITREDLKKAALDEMLRLIREVEAPTPSSRLSMTTSSPNVAANRQSEPGKLGRFVKGELDWIVLKALSKERERRYESALTFAHDIERFLNHEPVSAGPPSTRYRVRKFVQRHRQGVLTALGFVVLLVAAASVSIWQAIVAMHAERDATTQRDQANTAKQQADDARYATELALTASREKSARMTYERAQGLCEEGKADLGLLWMARALELTPESLPDLDRAIRLSINLWARQLNTYRPIATKPDWDKIGNVIDVASSPDGLSVLTLSLRYEQEKDVVDVHLWESATGQLRYALPYEAGPRNPVDEAWRCVGAFSGDGRYVAATSGDKRVRVWAATTGKLVGQPLVHDGPVNNLAFDPRGEVLATASAKNIYFWRVATGVREQAILTLPDEVLGVEYRPDGKQLLVWTAKQITLWDSATRQQTRAVNGVDFGVEQVAYSPDGRYLVAIGGQHQATAEAVSVGQFWEVATGQPTGTRMKWKDRHLGSAYHHDRVRFRPDGRMIVTGGFPLRLWHVPSGAALGVTPDGELTGGAERPVFGRGGNVLIAIPYGQLKHTLDLAPALEPSRRDPSSNHGDRMFQVAADGRTWVAADWLQTERRLLVHLVDLTTGQLIGAPLRVEPPHGQPLRAMPTYSADGRWLVVGGQGGCQVVNTATGQPHGPRLATTGIVTAYTFSPDGQQLVVGARDGLVQFWNIATGQTVGAAIKHQHTIKCLRFSPDGQKLLVGGGQIGGLAGEARLWDVATRQALGPVLEHTGEVNDIAFSPDGTTFVTGSFKLSLWNTATSQLVWTAPTQAVVLQLAFHPTGRTLLARLMEENAARLFDARTGTPVSTHLRHQGPLTQATLSGDGRFVLTMGDERQARLWDSATGLPLGPPWTGLASVPRGAFTVDSRGVLLQEVDSVVRWSIPEPLEGTPERIRLAVEAATRSALDPHGGLRLMLPTPEPDPTQKNRVRWSADPLDAVRQRLNELGGPPGALRR